MEGKGRGQQCSLAPDFVTFEQRYPDGGTVTKLRTVSRNSNEYDRSGVKFVKILRKTPVEGKELATRSDAGSSNLTSSRSGKEEYKICPASGLKIARNKVTLERPGGRDEVRSGQHPPVYGTPSAKPKTPRPGKAPQFQVTKQKGDSSKIRDKVTKTHIQTTSERHERGTTSTKLEGKTNTTGQKPSNASDKSETSKQTNATKHDCKKQPESGGRRRSKPPQYPSEDDVNSTAKVLKSHGYLMEGKLGEGTYAKVRRAYSYHHNCRVAIKIVSRQRLNARFQQKFLPRELEIVRSNRHPHIIELLDLFENNGVIFLIMELARHGDLLEYVQKKNALRDSEARTVFGQILSAVDYLHTRGIFHRDLKCENVLLEWGPTGIIAKITDFGFARPWSEAFKPCATFCGSAAYASPEILQAIPYDPHWADIWSLGVVLYIMITGRMPFDDSNIKEALDDMLNNRLNFSRRRLICIEVQRLLRSMLTYDPRDRPTTQQIRNSPWMRGRCTMPKPSARLSSSVGVV